MNDYREAVARAFFEKRSSKDVSWASLDQGVREGWLAYADRQLAVILPALEPWIIEREKKVAENVRRYYTE